ncbi:MAG: hypothetical protein NDJ94_15625 [Vicinamibacteria bacterium]|nr:hypothetical protein [Vicinamibacteria bacterium]
MKETARLPYSPPEIRRVTLAAEELAAAACKSVKVGNFCKKGATLYNKTIGS